MTFDEGTVFVLGAGFTKAFLPQAPLMVDDHGGKELLAAFKAAKFQEAASVLEIELKASNGKVNLERLMTRLHGRMPYDHSHGADAELDLLQSKITHGFQDRLAKAMASEDMYANDLRNFARHCVSRHVHCITFNYDDLLDRALWEANPGHGYGTRWNPNTGYAFPCRGSKAWFQESHPERFSSSLLLLKLHGSINWRIPLGHPKPYGLDAIRHHEKWYAECLDSILSPEQIKPLLEEIEPLLEPGFFFVPPVLTKSELVEQPILRFLWSKAYELLSLAKGVVFMGYSLPLTDVAAGFLFREALQHLDASAIRVVDFVSDEANTKSKQRRLLQSYRDVFPGISESQLDFSGARKWVFENLTQWLYNSKGSPIAFIFGMHVISRRGRFIGTMVDGEIVWGEGHEGKSPYRGVMEGDRLLFREEEKASVKYMEVKAPVLPGVPAALPNTIEPTPVRPGHRDVELDEDR